MAATYEAAPGTTRRALSAAGAVSLLVAGAYALGVVRIGADLIGESTWPVELGFDRNGDYTYPRVSEAAIGAVVVLVGVLLVVVVARAIRGSRSAAAGAAVFLAVVVAAGLANAAWGSETADNCVRDAYSGGEYCIAPSRAALRDGLLLAVPAGLALVGVGLENRRPRHGPPAGF